MLAVVEVESVIQLELLVRAVQVVVVLEQK
jgi:hypothetical protein